MIAIAAEQAADGRNGLGGIVDEFVGGFGPRGQHRERAIAMTCVRSSLRMEKVFGRLCAGERPLIFITPLINSHDEDLHHEHWG